MQQTDYKSPLDSVPQISEINMTPLMDLTFILLITFIITFPLIEQGIPLNLPEGNATELANEESATISMDKGGLTYLNDVPIESDRLQARIEELAAAEPDLAVYVRANRELKYGDVAGVLMLLHDAGIVRVALATQAERER